MGSLGAGCPLGVSLPACIHHGTGTRMSQDALRVIRVPLGISAGAALLLPFVNAYLVGRDDRWMVVDTGSPGNAARIRLEMARHGVREDQITLILLTHGHLDHYGSALALRRMLGGRTSIAMHPADRQFLSGRLPTRLRPVSPAGAPGLALGMLYVALLKLAGKAAPWTAAELESVRWLEQV